MNDFASACRRHRVDIEAEATRLIEELGVPPYEAIDRAVEIVARRRRQETREQENPNDSH